MSIEAINAVFGSRLKPREKLVLLAIADYASQDMVAWPSYDRLCAKTSMARATIAKAVKNLRSYGCITVENHSIFGDGKKVNCYRLDIEKIREFDPKSSDIELIGKTSQKFKMEAPTKSSTVELPKVQNRPSKSSTVELEPPLEPPIRTTNRTSPTGEESISANGKLTPCPHLKIVEQYNRILGDLLPAVKPNLWGGERKKNLAARWKEDKERQNIQWWALLFGTIREMPWLVGQNDSGWTADLGWIVRPRNLVKILEGKYLQRPGPGKQPMKPRNMREAQTLINDQYAKILLEERRRKDGNTKTGTNGDALLESPFLGENIHT